MLRNSWRNADRSLIQCTIRNIKMPGILMRMKKMLCLTRVKRLKVGNPEKKNIKLRKLAKERCIRSTLPIFYL